MFDKIVYYTGLTDNPKRRLREHKSGFKSRWMMEHNIRPLHICYIECFDCPYKARDRELQIKKLSLKNKLILINNYA